jgi:cyanophycin synthetase
MKIGELRAIAGPNIYSHRPVLVMQLYLEELSGRETRQVEGFNEQLLNMLPGLLRHHCNKEYEGGFSERLEEGTYFGHVIEHVALELTRLAGVPVVHGKTREAGEPGCFTVVIEYKAEQGTRYLLRTALGLVVALIKGEAYPLADELDEARRIIERTELGPSTRAIVEAAERRGIPWQRLDEQNMVQLGYGRHQKLIAAAMTA